MSIGKSLICVAAIFMALVAIGCFGENKIRVGVCVANGGTVEYREIHRGMTAAAKELGVKLKWYDVDAERNGKSTITTEKHIIDWMIGDELPTETEIEREPRKPKSDIDVLIWNPVSSETKYGYAIIRKARQKKIPIIMLDEYLNRLDADLLVMPNYVEMGRLAAQQAVASLEMENKRVNVVVMEEPYGDRWLRQVTLGIYQVLDGYEGVNVIGGTHVSTMNQAMGAVSRIINRYAGNVQAIVACNSEMIAGAIEALRAYNLLEVTVTVGVGADESSVRNLIKGDHDYEVDPMHFERGQIALRAAVTIASGQEVPIDGTVDNYGRPMPVKYGPSRIINRRRAYLLKEKFPHLWSSR